MSKTSPCSLWSSSLVPPRLRDQLLLECRRVAQQGLLVDLPVTRTEVDGSESSSSSSSSSSSVAVVLECFRQHVQQQEGDQGAGAGAAVSGFVDQLLVLFEGALGALLLYEAERTQYEQIVAQHCAVPPPPSSGEDAENSAGGGAVAGA